MKKICIIGAGQLGSRHLQALKNIKEKLDIYVIDPNEESLNCAKQRYNEFVCDNSIKHDVSYNIDYNFLPKEVDLAIVASTSQMRSKIVLKLLETAQLKYLVLEKLLFTKVEDFETIKQALIEHKTKAWVNCPMRMMDIYKDMKMQFANAPLNYSVSGVGYGLVTNLIHYIDCMTFITECEKFKLNFFRTEKKLVNSKRNGYYELLGEIQVDFSDGSKGNFICYENGQLPFLAEMYNSEKRIIIDEINGKAYNFKCAANFCDEGITQFRIPYQSELTTKLVESLLKDATCDLPCYEQSMKIHLQIMNDTMNFIHDEIGSDMNEYLFT